MKHKVYIRQFNEIPYLSAWQSMQEFTNNRDEKTIDELWFLEHPAVFTQGLAGKPEHILNPGSIPVIQTDRGGQVTYHGPGQMIVYFLMDIRRKNLGIRSFVSKIEQAVIDLLADHQILATANLCAPGVYIQGDKIASIGLRIRKGASYHGLSFNIEMDLSPFQCINPCGMRDLRVVQLKDFVNHLNKNEIKNKLITHLCRHLGYTEVFD